MNYLDEIALEIYLELDWATDKPTDDEMVLFRIYAVLCRSLGSLTSNEHVHDAWSAWMAARIPDHRSLVPYADLTPTVQSYDTEYRDAIRRVAVRRFVESAP